MKTPVILIAAIILSFLPASGSFGLNTPAGVDDLVAFDTDVGAWYVMSINSNVNDVVLWGERWGWGTADPVPGDYDGDGLDDLAVFDGSTGYWYIYSVEGGMITWAQQWGWDGATPVGGDYDGDQKDDLAVYDSAGGYWYILSLTQGVIVWAQQWGWPGAETVSGDYDGDGRCDLAVYDQNSGYWYILSLTRGVIAWAQQWGWPGAEVVPGDYDGDTADDLTVYDRNTGYWYSLSVTNGVIMWARQWGWASAETVPGDYNGDGVSDLAIFDQNTGYWYILSIAGSSSVLAWDLAWGWSGAAVFSGEFGEASGSSGSTTVVTSTTTTTTPGTIGGTGVTVAGGSFTMGDTWGDGEEDETPTHSVTISEFTLSRYEVTNEKMREVLQWAYDNDYVTIGSDYVKNVGEDPQDLIELGDDSRYLELTFNSETDEFEVDPDKDNFPSVGLTWYGAVAYCHFLSLKEGYESCYNIDAWTCDWTKNGYRLPTEAEWEYAARGGADGADTQYSGSDNIDTVAWYAGTSSNGTSQVGTKGANELGLYDMSGSAWEWCWDWFAPYSSTSETDPTGPAYGSEGTRVLRGGCWNVVASECRVSRRYGNSPETGNYFMGVRVVTP